MWLIQVADPQPAARRICSHSGHLLPRAALLQSCTQGCHQMYAFSCNFSCKQETAAVSHISVFPNMPIPKDKGMLKKVLVSRQLLQPTACSWGVVRASARRGCCQLSWHSFLQGRLPIENTSPGQLRWNEGCTWAGSRVCSGDHNVCICVSF